MGFLGALLLLLALPAFSFAADYDPRLCHEALADDSRVLLDDVLAPLPGVKDTVVVIIVNSQSKVLMGQRIGKSGNGEWAFIGGKADPGESIRQTALRETAEEVGVTLQNMRYLTKRFHLIPGTDRVYRSFFVTAEIREGLPSVLEPLKMGELGWFDVRSLPRPIYLEEQNQMPQLIELLQL
jgi:8-oxo-dGTP diphosphatase